MNGDHYMVKINIVLFFMTKHNNTWSGVRQIWQRADKDLFHVLLYKKETIVIFAIKIVN